MCVQICMYACSFCVCVGVGGGGGGGTMGQSEALAAYSVLMCTQSSHDVAASHHSRITGARL